MTKYSITLFCLTVLMIASCDKTDPIIPNEEEIITFVKYELTPTSGGTPVVLTFSDIDGDGGASPVISEGTLEQNQTYSAKIELLNQQSTPAIDISKEVLEEAEEHQFFYETNPDLINIEYRDLDDSGLPLGLLTTLKTKDKGSSEIKITLRHQPNKNGIDVAKGFIANAGGETDLEISFKVDVQ